MGEYMRRQQITGYLVDANNHQARLYNYIDRRHAERAAILDDVGYERLRDDGETRQKISLQDASRCLEELNGLQRKAREHRAELEGMTKEYRNGSEYRTGSAPLVQEIQDEDVSQHAELMDTYLDEIHREIGNQHEQREKINQRLVNLFQRRVEAGEGLTKINIRAAIRYIERLRELDTQHRNALHAIGYKHNPAITEIDRAISRKVREASKPTKTR